MTRILASILTAILVWSAAPALAHSDEELAVWQADWETRRAYWVAEAAALDWNLTLELSGGWAFLLREQDDWEDRHKCQLLDQCRVVTRTSSTASTPRNGFRSDGVYRGMGNGGSDVEQWRSLVAAFFPAGAVEKALAVLRCESGGNPNAINQSGSSAAGVFQFLRDTWNRVAVPLGYASYDTGAVFDGAANIHAASVLSKGGSTWAAWSCG